MNTGSMVSVITFNRENDCLFKFHFFFKITFHKIRIDANVYNIVITLCCLIYEIDQCGFRTAQILRPDFFIDELERVASRVNICSAQGIEMPHIEPAHDRTPESASNYAQREGIVSISFVLFLVSSFFFYSR